MRRFNLRIIGAPIVAASLLLAGGTFATGQEGPAREKQPPRSGGENKPDPQKPDTPKPDAPKPTPKPDAPKPDAPKPTPKPDAPKPTPRPDAPKATPKPDAPKATPKPDAPKATPKPDAPKSAPKSDAPKSDAPKSDANKPDAPKSDARKSDTPKSDASKADASKPDATKPNATKPDAAKPDARAEGKRKTATDLGFEFSTQRSERGLAIANVTATSVAGRAKFRQGDVIVSVNNNRINTQNDLIYWLYANPNRRVTIIVLRDAAETTLYLEPDVLIEETQSTRGWLGVDLDDRYEQDAVILKVQPKSPAERAGLRAGDSVVTFGDREVTSPDDLINFIVHSRPGDKVELEIQRDRQTKTLEATIGQHTETARRTEPLPRR